MAESDLILFRDSSYTVGLKPEKNGAFCFTSILCRPLKLCSLICVWYPEKRMNSNDKPHYHFYSSNCTHARTHTHCLFMVRISKLVFYHSFFLPPFPFSSFVTSSFFLLPFSSSLSLSLPRPQTVLSYFVSQGTHSIANSNFFPHVILSAQWLQAKSLWLFHQSDIPSIPSPGQAYGYEEVALGVLRKQQPPPKDTTLGPAYYNPLLVRRDTHRLNVHPSENVKCSFVHACVLSLVCTTVCLSVLTLPTRRGPLV